MYLDFMISSCVRVVIRNALLPNARCGPPHDSVEQARGQRCVPGHGYDTLVREKSSSALMRASLSLVAF
jgi:hypothetical protein